MTIDAPRKQIRFERSTLPESLKRISITNLHVAGATVDLALARYPVDVGLELLRREGDVEIIIQK